MTAGPIHVQLSCSCLLQQQPEGKAWTLLCQHAGLYALQWILWCCRGTAALSLFILLSISINFLLEAESGAVFVVKHLSRLHHQRKAEFYRAQVVPVGCCVGIYTQVSPDGT